MIAAALSFSLLTGLLPHHAPATEVRAKVDGWTYEVRTDGFTGEKACKLYARDAKSGVRMTYVSGAVAFHFGRGLDTQSAVYRIDDGAPRASRDDAIALVQHHVVLPDPVLNQGTQGLVFIPDQAVAGARQVSIRPNPKTQPKAVSLAGFDHALAAAQAQGCAPAAFAQMDLAE